MFHITKKENLKSIMSGGLSINSGIGGFTKKRDISLYFDKYGMQPIFLTNDIEHTIASQLTFDYIKDCMIVSINTDCLRLEEEYDYLQKDWKKLFISEDFFTQHMKKIKRNKHFISRDNITPNNISVYKSRLI